MKSNLKKILLVDDDPGMLDIGRIIIQRAGYRFVGAESGEAGLEKVLQERPDLIILDYMMPEMNGEQFFRTLREDPRFREVREIPVIMLTARSDDNIDQTSLFREGLAAFLFKPFGHRELINVIGNVLKMAEIRQRNIRLEEEIERTRYRYRDLVENANDVIFTLDQEGKVNFVNPQLKRSTGLPESSWLNHFLVDLVIPQDQAVVEEAIVSVLQGKPQQFQMRVRDASQTIRFFSTTLNPLREGNEITGMVGIARDLTDRRQLESRIESLESFTDSIIRSMGSGLITVDQNRRITYFNAAAEEILGFRAEEVLNRSIDEIFLNGESRIILPPDETNNRAIFSQEAVVTSRAGKKVHIGFSHTPWVGRDEKQLGTIITFRDISETKRMQIEMVRMDRLASLGVLAAGIAHEIRNPLAGIKTIAQTMEEEISDDHPHREYLQRIIRQVNRLDELLRAFFSYARPRPPMRKHHELPDIVHEVMILLDKRLKSSRVRFESDYAPDLRPVFVDLNQIQQMFLNLFLNALDAMPDGGVLRVSAENVRARPRRMERRGRPYRPNADQERDFVKVQVSDTGVGIRQDHLNSIFDPFFTTKPQGTGLGLSIVYRIVEEHGGEIDVESELGKGTTFVVLLPTEDEH